MFNKIANFIDHSYLRRTLFVVFVIAGCPITLLCAVFIARISTEPVLAAISIAGLLGVIGAYARLSHGSNFMQLSIRFRATVAFFLAVGTLNAFVAAWGLARFGNWPIFMCCVGIIGLFLLAGSVDNLATGPNNSFKRTAAPKIE